jgi:hypothetical protein
MDYSAKMAVQILRPQLCVDVMKIIFDYVDEYLTWSKMKTLEQVFGLRYWEKNMLITKMILSVGDIVNRNKLDLPTKFTHLIVKGKHDEHTPYQEASAVNWLNGSLLYLKLPVDIFTTNKYFCGELLSKRLPKCKLDVAADKDWHKFLLVRSSEHFVRETNDLIFRSVSGLFFSPVDVTKLSLNDDNAMKHISSNYYTFPNLHTFSFCGKKHTDFDNIFRFSNLLANVEIILQDAGFSMPFRAKGYVNLLNLKICAQYWNPPMTTGNVFPNLESLFLT